MGFASPQAKTLDGEVQEKDNKLDASVDWQGGPENVMSLDWREDLVVDAGFDAMIRQKWTQLIDKGRANFLFAVPSRGQAVRMTVKTRESALCAGDVEAKTQTQAQANRAIQCFSVTTKNWLFSLFFKPIVLAYDADSIRLLAFRGLSNIQDNNGQAQSVLIQYRYPDSELTGVDSAQF